MMIYFLVTKNFFNTASAAIMPRVKRFG